MINTSLRDQLIKATNSKKIKVKHFDGEKKWKKKFNHFFKLTKDVKQTLDIMYGPNGGVNNYKGSLYRNSRVDINKEIKNSKKLNTKNNKKSKIFSYIKHKKRSNYKK